MHRRRFGWLAGRGTRWLAGLAVVFALGEVVGATVQFELLWVFVLALIWGSSRASAARDEARRLAATEGLNPIRTSPGMRTAFISLQVMWWCGALGTAAFAGMIVALPLS
jgi:hypothetical protein